MKFNIGDTVQIIKEDSDEFGEIGTITKDTDGFGEYGEYGEYGKIKTKNIGVEFSETGSSKYEYYNEKDLLLIKQWGADLAQSIIKDSGDRTKYLSGAVRDKRAGKGMISLIPPQILDRVAKHYEAGRIKYSDENNVSVGAENWRKGMLLLDFYDSIMHHLEKWRRGEYDEDHGAACIWNAICLFETERRIQKEILPKELDNRDINDFDNPRDLYK